jgi:hypothetical protein
MRWISLACAAAITCCLFAAKAQDDKKAGAGQADMDAMMKQMAEMAKPNEHHKALAALEGDWAVENTMQMTPDAQPMKSTGTSHNKMILGGRFLQGEFKGTFMNMPFEGVGLLGYDPMKKKHVSVWADSMSGGVMTSYGDCDGSCKTITFTDEVDDPSSGKKMPVRYVYTIESKDKYMMEWYETHDGKEFKAMTIVYTRTK